MLCSVNACKRGCYGRTGMMEAMLMTGIVAKFDSCLSIVKIPATQLYHLCYVVVTVCHLSPNLPTVDSPL